ncbi:MAG: helix-turn-helix domain-containing protein [Acidimicrobiales bacterium]
MKSKPEALRELRQRKGHTVRSFAEACDLSRTRVSELEREALGLLPTTAKRIADALGVEIDDVATISEEVA